MMDILAVLFICCVSFLIGVIVTLVVQYYILYSYLEKSPLAQQVSDKKIQQDFNLPEVCVLVLFKFVA